MSTRSLARVKVVDAARVLADDASNERVLEALAMRRRAQSVMAKPLERRLDEIAFYPPHDKRVKSTAYKTVHHRLVVERDTPCRVCGVRNSTLKSARANPYGARAMETHHCVIEWALAKAVDPTKFNRVVLPELRARHPENSAYRKLAMTAKEIAAWIDHSEDNLWVLCDVHHRAEWFGVHSISGPVWAAQTVLRDDFEAMVRGRLAKRVVVRAGDVETRRWTVAKTVE